MAIAEAPGEIRVCAVCFSQVRYSPKSGLYFHIVPGRNRNLETIARETKDASEAQRPGREFAGAGKGKARAKVKRRTRDVPLRGNKFL